MKKISKHDSNVDLEYRPKGGNDVANKNYELIIFKKAYPIGENGDPDLIWSMGARIKKRDGKILDESYLDFVKNGIVDVRGLVNFVENIEINDERYEFVKDDVLSLIDRSSQNKTIMNNIKKNKKYIRL
jgi:hypothetical protein